MGRFQSGLKALAGDLEQMVPILQVVLIEAPVFGGVQEVGVIALLEQVMSDVFVDG